MKISKLHIDQFRHLENLDFDFTYQSGDRKGQPLDKICFIGQSATGKTGLLELVYETFSYILNLEVINDVYAFGENKKLFNNEVDFEININSNLLKKEKKEIIYKNKVYKVQDNNLGILSDLIVKSDRNNIVFIKSNIISDKNIKFLNSNPIELRESINNNKDSIVDGNLFEFDDEISNFLWSKLLINTLDFHGKRYQKYNELISKGLISDLIKFNAEVQDFLKNNPNPLSEMALKFNTVFEKLGLKIAEQNTEYSIPINYIRKDKIIPIKETSTGTKQLILTSLPLYQLDTKDAIILIDEPERSLYPDMQMELMDHYKRLAPQAQFIVATHSPFIAASFEADERFILYFDEEGKVAVRRGTSPIGDDPNDMLKNDFGVNYYNKFGEEAYKKYVNLKEDLAKEKDPIKKKELLLKTVKLGDTYNF